MAAPSSQPCLRPHLSPQLGRSLPHETAHVLKPAKTSRRQGSQELRHVARRSRPRVAHEPPRRTRRVPNQGAEYAA